MKVCPKTKKSTYFFTCTAGHLNNSFVPAVGHLPVCFQKIVMPGSRPGGVGEGHYWKWLMHNEHISITKAIVLNFIEALKKIIDRTSEIHIWVITVQCLSKTKLAVATPGSYSGTVPFLMAAEVTRKWIEKWCSVFSLMVQLLKVKICNVISLLPYLRREGHLWIGIIYRKVHISLTLGSICCWHCV